MSDMSRLGHPVINLIARRRSPFGFDYRRILEGDLRSLFKAARLGRLGEQRAALVTYIRRNRARRLYQVAEGVKVVAALAIGYAGADSRLAESYQQEDMTSRPRKPLDAFIFSGTWLKTAPVVRTGAR